MTVRQRVFLVLVERVSVSWLADREGVGRALDAAGIGEDDQLTVQLLGAPGRELLPPTSRYAEALVHLPATVADPGEAGPGDVERVVGDLARTRAMHEADGLEPELVLLPFGRTTRLRLRERLHRVVPVGAVHPIASASSVPGVAASRPVRRIVLLHMGRDEMTSSDLDGFLAYRRSRFGLGDDDQLLIEVLAAPGRRMDVVDGVVQPRLLAARPGSLDVPAETDRIVSDLQDTLAAGEREGFECRLVLVQAGAVVVPGLRERAARVVAVDGAYRLPAPTGHRAYARPAPVPAPAPAPVPAPTRAPAPATRRVPPAPGSSSAPVARTARAARGTGVPAAVHHRRPAGRSLPAVRVAAGCGVLAAAGVAGVVWALPVVGLQALYAEGVVDLFGGGLSWWIRFVLAAAFVVAAAAGHRVTARAPSRRPPGPRGTAAAVGRAVGVAAAVAVAGALACYVPPMAVLAGERLLTFARPDRTWDHQTWSLSLWGALGLAVLGSGLVVAVLVNLVMRAWSWFVPLVLLAAGSGCLLALLSQAGVLG